MTSSSGSEPATLYVSDLDFTLLGRDATLSARTIAVINELVGAGQLFTYATARSYYAASRITTELHLHLPLITYGGAVLADPVDGTFLDVRPLPVPTVEAIKATDKVEPILFCMVDGRDRVCWREQRVSPFVRTFLARRTGDPRLLPIADWRALPSDCVFSATLIGERAEILDLRAALDSSLVDCFTTLGPDGYDPEQTWLEIYAKDATKAAAITRLRQNITAQRLVVFGDNLNDVPMFEMADYACAVANAVPEVLAIADEVVSSNDEDGVASWLAETLIGRTNRKSLTSER